MRNRATVAATVVMSLVAACGGAGATSTPTAPPSTPTSAPTEAPTATPAPTMDATKFVVGWSSTPDEKYLPYLMAIDAMTEAGYQVSGTQVASDDILYQGLTSNDIQAGMGGASQVANAVAAGVPIKIVETRSSTDAVYVAANAYSDCSTLANQPVGIYSPQAILTLFMEQYFSQNCPGVNYTAVTIADSGLRAQAMEQGQIVATVLGLSDAIALDANNPGKFTEVSFGQTLPGIGDAYLVANQSTLSDHAGLVEAWVAANLKAIRDVYQADDATLAGLETKYFPDAKDDSILKSLRDAKLWQANGGLAGDGLTQTLSLFKLPGDRATLVDDGPLTAALAEVGSSTLTDR